MIKNIYISAIRHGTIQFNYNPPQKSDPKGRRHKAGGSSALVKYMIINVGVLQHPIYILNFTTIQMK